jgi:hypothetical protein
VIDVAVVAVAAALVYASRAASVVLLPAPRGALRAYVERLPGPLFAGLAVFALVGGSTAWPDAPVLGAAIAAVAVAPVRSLAVTLCAGLATYAALAVLT